MRHIPLLVVAAVSACTLVASADAGGSGFRLAAVNVDGTHRQRLLNDMQVSVLDFSPDRRRIVFTRGEGLYVGNPDESGSLKLLSTRASVWPAHASPDGQLIAFEVTGKLNPAASTQCGLSVWTIRTDGSQLGLVSDCAILANFSGSNEQPWSPDSSELAFVGNLQPPQMTMGTLTVAKVDGTGRREFGGIAKVKDIAWDPRGDRLAYSTSLAPKQGLRLKVVDLREGTVASLGRGYAPTWAHGGRRIAFIDAAAQKRPSSRAYVGEIAFGRNGFARSRLRSTFVVGSLIAWSPDDRALAFTGCRATRFCRQPQVYFIRSDGSRLHQITNEHDIATVVFERIWWAPSSSRLFFSRHRLGA